MKKLRRLLALVVSAALLIAVVPHSVLAVVTDTDGPVITIVSCDRKNQTLYEGDSIKLTFKVEDSSGVGSNIGMLMTYTDPDGKNYREFLGPACKLNATTGLYECTFTVSETHKVGTYKFAKLHAYDAVGNYSYINPNLSFVVAGTETDTNGPVITEISCDKVNQTLYEGDSIKYTFKLEDPSGIGSNIGMLMTYTAPDGSGYSEFSGPACVYNPDTDLYECTFTVGSTHKIGTYEFAKLHAYDKKGNQSYIRPDKYFYVVVGPEIVNYGTCGENLTWTLDNTGTLTISGTGAMYDWDLLKDEERPWYSIRNSIKAVVVNDGVTTIGKSAFYDCKQLTDVCLAESVKEICSFAFYNCTKLETFSIPASVSSISNMAFVDCSSLNSFVVSADNRYYSSPDGVLCEKSTGTLINMPGGRIEAVIPDEISIIGGYAFSGPSITSVVIPKSVKTVRIYAFYYCDNLQSITIKGNASLNNGFIDSCDKISEFIAEESDIYSSMDGVLYSKDMTTLVRCPPTKTAISIPETIEKIGYEAFEHCRYLYEIILPGSVKTIESSAFLGCSNLQRITLPEKVSKIESYVFSNCSSLTSIIIPSGVSSIGRWSFYGCKSLKHILYGGSASMWNQITKDTPEIPEGAVFTYNFQEGTSYHVYDDDTDTHCNVCNQFRLIGCVGETLGVEITTNANYDYRVVGATSDVVSVVFTGQTSIIIGSTGRYCKGYDLRFSKAGNYELRFVQETTGSTITFYAEISDHTYDHACDTSCNSCGVIRQTQHVFNTEGICTICSALEHIPGDIDGNESVTQDDAVYLLLHTMFGEAFYPLNGAEGDIDCSGSVDQDDAVYLLLHTMFGEMFYPLNTPALPVKTKE